MKQLNDSFTIRNTTIRNRICVPPMVLAPNADENGFVTDAAVRHYTALAQGGPGLIIQEATCVSPEGKLGVHQIGLWCDEHIEGNRRIAAAVHAEGVPIVVQIHHAGVVGIAEAPLCPSAYTIRDKQGVTMTEADILATQQQFIDAGIRAYKSGYDGVELHGCHSYLISQFFNKHVNRREDAYADAMAFVRPIIEGIRAGSDVNFLIGIRLGCFEPTLADGIAHAQALEAAGIDFLDISSGFDREADPSAPEHLPYDILCYAAGEIKKAVSVPVFAVRNICTPDDAKAVLEGTDVDMVDVARSTLVDFNWAKKTLNGEIPGKCLHCKRCMWYSDPEKCAGRLLMQRQANK